MAKVKTYTLTLDAQELRDVIEAALVCECQNAGPPAPCSARATISRHRS